MKTKQIIITILITITGLIIGYLFADLTKPKVIEKVVIKPITHEWKSKDSLFIALHRSDSIKICSLYKSIKVRDSRLERFKMIILKDTTKTSLEADSIIRMQDSTINDLGMETELYSRQLYLSHQQIAIRDSVIIDREKTINDYSNVISEKQSDIDKLNKKYSFQRFISNTFATTTTLLTIINILKQ
jgi:hypothetical protein